MNIKNKKSILLQVDKDTKGIMDEIKNGITEDIISPIDEQKRVLKDLNEKINEVYQLEIENKKLLKKLLKKLEQE